MITKTSSICVVCGNKLLLRFNEVLDPITKDFFSVYNCSSCGLGHTLPQPDNMNEYYAGNYYCKRHSFTAEYCIRRRIKFLKHATAENKLANGKLLDIGCGDGSFLLAARKNKWEVMGTEINPAPARESGLDVRENLELLSDDNKFDLITMWHSLEHLPVIKDGLNKAAKFLNAQGKIIIAVPNYGGLQAKFFQNKWLHLDVPRHLYHFNAGALRFALESSGFTICHLWHQELEYDLIGWAQSFLNCLLPHPNYFLDCLMGKDDKKNKFFKTLNMFLGFVITILSLPLLAVGTLINRGGTIIVVAEKK